MAFQNSSSKTDASTGPVGAFAAAVVSAATPPPLSFTKTKSPLSWPEFLSGLYSGVCCARPATGSST
jgi:hypothetical protein